MHRHSAVPVQLSLLWDRRWVFKPGWSGITSTQVRLHCRKSKNELRVMSGSWPEWTMSHVQKVYFFSRILPHRALNVQAARTVSPLLQRCCSPFVLSMLSYLNIVIYFQFDWFRVTLTLVLVLVLCKHTPSWASPFLFSCMAISKLLCKILLSVLIQSSISASLSAANRYVLLSCIFSSKANRRTLLFCSHRAEVNKRKNAFTTR